MRTGARPTESSRAPAGGAPIRRAFEPGEPVGRWRVERLVKAGRVFEVWAARDAAGTRAAIKTPLPLDRDRESARALLRYEHERLRDFGHPRIVTPYALVDTESCTALVTEWLGGGDLVSLAGFAPRHWLGPLAELVGAVAYLHARGFVHRDVKARNVMLDARGRARLIDFASTARIGAAVTSGGTTQAHRRPGASRGLAARDDDAYALAVLIYELRTGRLPRARALEVPRPSGEDVPDRALDWAMARLDPARRTPSGNISALAAVLNLTHGS